MVSHGWLNMAAKQNKLIDLLLSPLYIYICYIYYIYVYVYHYIFNENTGSDTNII